MDHFNGHRFGIIEVATKTQVSSERLRYWEKVNIICPKYIQCGTRKFRRYSVSDVAKIMTIKNLVDVEKYSLKGAAIKSYQQ